MKVLNSYAFTGRSGKKSSYDWDTILDGQIRQLEQGEDFDCKLATICTLIRKAAKDRGMSVRVSQNKEDMTVVVQANRETVSLLGEEDITPPKPRRGRKRGAR